MGDNNRMRPHRRQLANSAKDKPSRTRRDSSSKQARSAGFNALRTTTSMRELERVLHHVVGNLLAHVHADLERVAEMDPAPNPHIALLIRQLLDAGKLTLFVESTRSVAVTGTLCADGTTNSSTRADTPATIAACDGYSGCIGVAFDGVQPASRSVASLPSISPLRIAVTGRQKL
jgi:hypothetical protein